MTHESHFFEFSILKAIPLPSVSLYLGQITSFFSTFLGWWEDFFPVSFSQKRKHHKVLALWFYLGFSELRLSKSKAPCGIRTSAPNFLGFTSLVPLPLLSTFSVCKIISSSLLTWHWGSYLFPALKNVFSL